MLRALASSVTRVVAVSADADEVYFVGGPQGVPGESAGRNLYLRDVDGVHLVTAGDVSNLTNPDINAQVELSADGRTLAFQDLALGVFLYRAPSVSAPVGELTCVTCSPGGTPAAEPSFFASAGGVTPQNLSDDGRVLVFDTIAALLPQDINGRRDVYEFTDGRLHLVSPGVAAADAVLLGMSNDGDDVFIVTAQSLLSTDSDGGDRDVYDARVGAIPPPPLPQPTGWCADETCQRAGEVTPPPIQAGTSATGDTPSSDSDARKPTLRWTRPTAAELRRWARHGTLRLLLRLPEAGRLRITARARLGRTTRTVAAATLMAPKPGTTRVRLRLSSTARRQLRAGRPLRVALIVRQTGVARPLLISLTLRQGGKR